MSQQLLSVEQILIVLVVVIVLVKGTSDKPLEWFLGEFGLRVWSRVGPEHVVGQKKRQNSRNEV